MSYINDDYNTARTRFYEQGKKFNSFKDINDKAIKKIDELIAKYKRTHIEHTTIYMPNTKVKEYLGVLKYLTVSRDLSFDEKILFIIRFFDPELKLLKLYFESEVYDKEEIKNEDNDFVKSSLNEVNFEFVAKCREEVGITDQIIIQYELSFFKNYLSKELKFNVKKDFIHKFFRTYTVDSINFKISDEELEIIIKNALAYKKKYGIPSLNDILFQLSEQRSSLSVTGKSKRELFIFMIYVLDQDFKALQIYDEYCNWDAIRNECHKEIGFYNQDFVRAEVKFAKANPDNQINLSLF